MQKKSFFKKLGAVVMAIAMMAMMVPGMVEAKEDQGDKVIEDIYFDVTKPVAGKQAVKPNEIDRSAEGYSVSFEGDAINMGPCGWQHNKEAFAGTYEAGETYELHFVVERKNGGIIDYHDTIVRVNGYLAFAEDASTVKEGDSEAYTKIAYKVSFTLGNGGNTDPIEWNIDGSITFDEIDAARILQSERPILLEVAKEGSTTAVGSVLFDLEATKAIFERGVDVRFVMDVNTEPDGDLSGYDLVVDLSVTGDGENLFTEGNGTATITLPYDKEVPEGKTVKVFYITDGGKEAIDVTYYDKDTKTVSFKVTHFSKYAIQQEQTASEPDSKSPKTGEFSSMATIVLMISTMGLAGAGFYAKKKEIFK